MRKDWKPVKKPGKRRLLAWRFLGPEQPIEPLNAGLIRYVGSYQANT